ncbi:hypothetical protein SKAU_G00236640 [Synaphobranchus kaupii]|uniref:Uncharacterized protein n=1 Tax=Synaphobranchus kaupii TaxID=118154 RepID=A0A9Q1F6T3_SYNKA|nr:hypothetical protein SKAU_G00236640 [Synaphobranchus kaupii]
MQNVSSAIYKSLAIAIQKNWISLSVSYPATSQHIAAANLAGRTFVRVNVIVLCHANTLQKMDQEGNP